MNSFTKKVHFLIDQRYARRVRDGRAFNPLLQPSMIGLYVLGLFSNMFAPSYSPATSRLSWKSRLMRFLGHSFFPDKYSLSEISEEEISKRRFSFYEKESPKVTFLVLCGNSLSSLVSLLESIEANSAEIEIELILIVEEIRTEMTQFIEHNIQGKATYRISESDNLLTTLNLAIASSKGEFFAVLSPSVLLRPTG